MCSTQLSVLAATACGQSSAARPTPAVHFRTSLRERCVSFRGRHASPSSSSLSLRSRRSNLGGLPRGLAPLDVCRFSAGCELPASDGARKHVICAAHGHLQRLHATYNTGTASRADSHCPLAVRMHGNE